jgi:predicted nucleotidyltransferase component of viral defense system
MFDANRHKFFMVQLLKEIYSDVELATCLGFKGGTALMLFYDLPRFSTDLDFDLLSNGKEDAVFQKIRTIVLGKGVIFDEARKHYGPLIVLDYGTGGRKLKIEISNRNFGSRYEVKNLLGFNLKVMVAPDMFAHKLCAMLDRSNIVNRDIFDIWFFLKRQTPVNPLIVEMRAECPLETHLGHCIQQLEVMKGRHMLDGLGELTQEETKQFIRTKLLSETISLLEIFRKYPILA